MTFIVVRCHAVCLNFDSGMNNIFQRPDLKPYGFTYSVVPESTSKAMDATACFGEEGTKDEPVDSIQTILPDTTNYKV